MAALEPYYFEPNMLQTPKMIEVKIVKLIIAWKNIFCRPCEGCKVSSRFFSLPPISSRTEWCHTNTALLPSTVQNGGLFREEFLQDSRHFKGWNFGEWKSWMFTCFRKSSFAISSARRFGPTLRTNTSVSGFGFHLKCSPPISKLYTSYKGRSTMYPFPCFCFNPPTVPSLPVILLTICPSFHNALSLASLSDHTAAPVFGIFSALFSSRPLLPFFKGVNVFFREPLS